MPERRVYLDHNATTPLHPEVRQAMIRAMDEHGNPSSLHEFGRAARSLIDEARHEVASLVNAKDEEIVFVGSGSEANNTVLNLFTCSGAPGCKLGSRKEVITTRIEHPCVLEASRCLSARATSVQYLDVDEYGKIKLDQLGSLLGDNTALVSVMAANNEIGTIQDLPAIIAMVHEAGAFFHTDAVQAVGKIPLDVKALDVDFLSFSAHKIYGPKGVGALYVKRGVPFCPFVHGGHQEQGRRAGTENTLGIVGFGKAVTMRKLEMESERMRISALREHLRSGIEDGVPDVRFNGHPDDSLYTTLNVSIAGCEGEALLLYLDLEGIAVSTGSACSSGSLDPSHVLLATGLPAEQAHGSLRLSLGRDNTDEDVDYVIEKLAAVVKKVRAMSTVY